MKTSLIHRSDGAALPALPLAPGMPEPVELSAVDEQADARMVLLDEEGRIKGHLALWWSATADLNERKTGALGGFHAVCEDDAALLLEAGADGLRGAGCRIAIGPMNGNTWRKHRYVTESKGRGSYLLEPRNPLEFPLWWQECGFTVLSRYTSSVLVLDGGTTVPAGLERKLERSGMNIRELDPSRFEEDLRAIHTVSLRSFKNNFLYTPLDEVEFLSAYAKVRERIDPAFVRIAERGGEPCGFVFAIADLEAAARGEKPALIVKTLAVDPDARCVGLGSLLVDQVHAIARRKGFTEAIHAMQHENNSSRRITSRHQGEIFRRYALFSKLL